MTFKFSMHYIRNIYIFFSFLALTIFFFSTTELKANTYEINNIEISKPFENNFDKSEVIDFGFKKAFFELIYLLIKSSDYTKIENVKLNQIKGMIESFSIQEERFIDQIYYVNLGVTFNKRKIFNFLEKKNIRPSQIKNETFLFVPIIIDENINEIKIFSNNPIYENWNTESKKYELINYLLPTEDLEDYNLIKDKLDVIETYSFDEITKKYFLNHSIISLLFKSKNEIRILTKIYSNKKEIIKNDSFKDIDLENNDNLNFLIKNLKASYEDTWKKLNEINTSIKLPLVVKMKNFDFEKTTDFEGLLQEIELVNNYFVQKIDKEFIFYEILFNGTVQSFINIMKNKNYNLNTQKKIWTIE